MCRRLEELIALHCGATIAGMKAGSMFTCYKKDIPNVPEYSAYYNACLNKQDIYLEILVEREDSWIIYVYRKSILGELLEYQEIQNFLQENGYPVACLSTILAFLKQRLLRDEFPHEIGIFLDYPLADVKAFIQTHGERYIALGDWKVYHDKEKAEQKFKAFKRCTTYLYQHIQRGASLIELCNA